jgi:hypothetical protein
MNSPKSLSSLQFQKAAVVLLSVSVDPDQMSLLARKIRQLKVGCVSAHINPISDGSQGLGGDCGFFRALEWQGRATKSVAIVLSLCFVTSIRCLQSLSTAVFIRQQAHTCLMTKGFTNDIE